MRQHVDAFARRKFGASVGTHRCEKRFDCGFVNGVGGDLPFGTRKPQTLLVQTHQTVHRLFDVHEERHCHRHLGQFREEAAFGHKDADDGLFGVFGTDAHQFLGDVDVL